jgi:AAA domain
MTVDLTALLERLNYTPDEHVQICTKAPGGIFKASVLPCAPAVVTQAEDVWYGINPVRPVTSGRPGADDITRLAALWADIDIDPRKCPDHETARAIVDDLSAMLGAEPVAITYSGHGIQPLWSVEDGQIDPWPRSEARALLRRWGRLVTVVAERRGSAVDSVWDGPRILRCPGSINHKDPHQPVPVICAPAGGSPLCIVGIRDALDEQDIPDHEDDRRDPGTIISAPDQWTYVNGTCHYAQTMINGWATDNPTARHPWLLSQATRVAAAHRNACLSPQGHSVALSTLASRFQALLVSGFISRDPGPGEIQDAIAWGQARAAAMSDRDIALELGTHLHWAEPQPKEITYAPLRAVNSNATMRNLPVRTTTPPQSQPTHLEPLLSDATAQTANTAAGEPLVDPQFAYDVENAARNLWVQDEARTAERRRKATTVHPPALTNLATFLAVEDDPIAYRIEGLLPVGGRVVLAAPAKGGKSTVMGNLIRSLVDGDPFLDAFDVNPFAGSVVLIDNELHEGQLRRWLRKQKMTNVDRVHVLPLRGGVGTFDIMNPEIRKQWVDKLQAVNCQFLIFDCLKPVLDALKLSEHTEAGQFLTGGFDALLKEANISEGVVVHHMGHGGERSRGDSSIRAWPDVEWRMVRDVDPGVEDPDADRYFGAFGRDVDCAEGLLEYSSHNNHVRYTQGTRKDAKAARKADRAPIDALPDILAYLATEADPVSGRAIERAVVAHGHKQLAVREGIKAGVNAHSILTEQGSHNAVLHFLDPSLRLVR